MKKIILSGMLILPVCLFAQNSTPFKMPAEIKFDKNVVQKMDGEKNGTLSYYFTTNGDYAALKPDSKEGALIIYTKEGNMLIVSDKEKSIIVMNMKKFVTDAAAKAKEMNIDKTSPKKDSTGAKSNFRKTGNTKTICGYPAEEYEITSEKGKMNIWYLKADFDSALLLSMGMGKGAGAGPRSSAGGNDLSNIPGIGKNFFMAEMEKNDKKVIETVSITKTDFTFSSTGYTVRDLSDMMKGKYN
jgi:hypothetical protein